MVYLFSLNIHLLHCCPSGYIHCATAGGTCSQPGVVAYGSGSRYTYRTSSGSISCNNDVFGDPVSGSSKECCYQSPSIESSFYSPVVGTLRCGDLVYSFVKNDNDNHYWQLITKSMWDVRIQNCGSGFDTQLYLYDNIGNNIMNGTGCDGDDCGSCSGNKQEDFTKSLLPPGEYFIRFRPWDDTCCGFLCCCACNDTGPYRIKVTCSGDYPTGQPTPNPTNNPTNPTFNPTNHPSKLPTKSPTNVTENPTHHPSKLPTTKSPTNNPIATNSTINPSGDPTKDPTVYPTKDPTENPTVDPTHPSKLPTKSPTHNPKENPTIDAYPTINPITHSSYISTEIELTDVTLEQEKRQSSNDSDDIGLIIGVVIGILLLIIIIIVILFIYKKKNKDAKQMGGKNNGISTFDANIYGRPPKINMTTVGSVSSELFSNKHEDIITAGNIPDNDNDIVGLVNKTCTNDGADIVDDDKNVPPLVVPVIVSNYGTKGENDEEYSQHANDEKDKIDAGEGIDYVINENTAEDVKKWLQKIGYDMYYDAFITHAFDSMELIKEINDKNDLDDIVKLTAHRLKIFHEIKKLTESI